MRIAAFGTGYVGLVSGTCFAELGNHVIGYDIDEKKIAALKNGHIPIYEPGLEELVKSNVESGRLTFTTDIKAAIKDVKVIFLGVGTPSAPDGSADLQYLFAAADAIVKNVKHEVVVATKSTVPVGTADKLRAIFKKTKVKIHVASNPEFLREGAAVKDFLNPERVIVGVDDDKLKPIFEQLYKGVARVERPLIFTSVRSAELAKYACNAFLATKISFINEIAALCEVVDADIHQIAYGMGLDTRIGSRFLHAGIGYGGSCFPKDVRALQHITRENGLTPGLLDAVDEINERQKGLLLRKLAHHLPKLKDKTIAVWGITFKPRTDDTRESPALTIIPKLLEAGARVQAYDPKGMSEARHQLPKETLFCAHAFDALKGADALLLLTEWDEFRTVDLNEVRGLMKGRILLDGRNIYNRQDATKAGLTYAGIGVSG
ncbi:MAG TPA: UDP-glucose/GDP-mannose dehydrogenase family protein [Candidatus Saccharimonadales bacterium]|nr:UDP-glucose/GDP-mannose dehydrogenase family protein [Candidatus Saccharimonadales bacterium]